MHFEFVSFAGFVHTKHQEKKSPKNRKNHYGNNPGKLISIIALAI
jgi:hypothetical protein